MPSTINQKAIATFSPSRSASVLKLMMVGGFEPQPDSSRLHALPVRLPFPTFSVSPNPSCRAITPHHLKTFGLRPIQPKSKSRAILNQPLTLFFHCFPATAVATHQDTTTATSPANIGRAGNQRTEADTPASRGAAHPPPPLCALHLLRKYNKIGVVGSTCVGNFYA